MIHSRLTLTVVLMIGATSLLRAEDKNKTALKQLEGTWQIETFKINGDTWMTLQGKKFDEHQFVVKGDRFTASATIAVEECKMTIDASAKPPRLDYRHVDKKKGLSNGKGIYKLKGDTLTFCFSYGMNNERPEKFASESGTQTILVTLKRIEK